MKDYFIVMAVKADDAETVQDIYANALARSEEEPHVESITVEWGEGSIAQDSNDPTTYFVN